jgi:hypothetical protein
VIEEDYSMIPGRNIDDFWKILSRFPESCPGRYLKDFYKIFGRFAEDLRKIPPNGLILNQFFCQ